MNGTSNFILDNFYTFFRVMLLIPSKIQSWQGDDVALAVFFLILAMPVIFLCDRLMKKYDLGFAANVLLAFLVLSLAEGLMGLIMSIPRLLVSASRPFLVLGIGTPVINIALGVIASLGNRLRKKYPKAGAFLLCGVGFPFAWVLATTFVLFFLGLYNY
ncbi:MAG TPA: hypothetical protein VI776_14235 [Anaerolineales bacterium]|nr:hypothetical protein [Anaerolineales bacterium]